MANLLNMKKMEVLQIKLYIKMMNGKVNITKRLLTKFKNFNPKVKNKLSYEWKFYR